MNHPVDTAAFFPLKVLAVAFVLALGMIPETTSQVPAPAQDGPVALVGGNIHLESGTVIQAGTLLFENGRIVALGTEVSVPGHARRIDVSGKEVYPGLILGRTTIGLSEIGRLSETTDLSEIGNINPNVRPQVAFHSASDHIGVAAVHGVTTAVISPSGGIISGQTAAMMTDGWTWEQMTLRAPLGLAITWPSMRNEAERQKALTELQEAFDSAKRYRQARASGKQHPVDLRWEAMLPVLDGSLPVFIQADELPHIQAAMTWAEKEGLRMVLVGGRDAGYMASQLAARGIPVMITPVVSGPARAWEPYDQSYALPARLHEAGVPFCIGGEASAAGAYRVAFHAGTAVAFGLPAEEALRAVTIGAARILGIDDRVGSLAPGKDATIIVTNGDPLELWTVTEMVFIQGRELQGTDKHLRLYQLYLEKHRQATPR
jgi:imidazolonepropionase-like amidohydrolase